MTTTEIPAERLLPGIAMQHVNVYVDGEFVRQMRYPGTAEEAQAYAAVLPLHDTHPEYLTLLAAFHAAKENRAAIAAISSARQDA